MFAKRKTPTNAWTRHPNAPNASTPNSAAETAEPKKPRKRFHGVDIGIFKGPAKTNLEPDEDVAPMVTDNRVTSSHSIDTDTSMDHRAILERRVAIGDKILKGELEEGIYRGHGAYRPAMKIREGAIAAGKSTGLFGPVRGSQNVRYTMRIDYNPEICKDYKETGYCGYGDTCKFIHDRSDYKSGWQLEKEWEEEQKKKQDALRKKVEKEMGLRPDDEQEATSGLSSDEDFDGCPQCRQEWNLVEHPGKMPCGHAFCEACGVKEIAKSDKCPLCAEPHGGILNATQPTRRALDPSLSDPEEM